MSSDQFKLAGARVVLILMETLRYAPITTMNDYQFKQLGTRMTGLHRAAATAQDLTSIFQPGEFTFGIVKLKISNTRSVDDDTLHASIAANVRNVGYQARPIHLGDHDNGEVAVNLFLPPIKVTERFGVISIAPLVVNSASPGERVAGQLISAGIRIAQFSGVLGVWGDLAALVTEFFSGILPGGCDGPVAMDRIKTNGFTLAVINQFNQNQNRAANGAPWLVDVVYQGLDSGAGCGDNSVYTVTYSYAWKQLVTQGGTDMHEIGTVLHR